MPKYWNLLWQSFEFSLKALLCMVVVNLCALMIISPLSVVNSISISICMHVKQ